jgi:AcrR family transcriptional regulator
MGERVPRADARRNRERILAVARVAFAEEGPDVALDTIAERAGVGAGTVHRHFPSKDALIAAVVVDRLAGLAARAEELADYPPEAFFDFLRELADEARQNLVLTSALGNGLGAAASEAGARLTNALGILLAHAQRAGIVRGDVTATDLHAILGGVFAIERGLPAAKRGLGLDLVIAGLRT